ncbi:MAG TPA: diphosphate--fructose-6-phosphate 1-phosphotransferase [Rhabdochlamydiaceae bacterium]|nr:diphosphate--fructose-6-phosphate 1-phosphotransferase [Rhabdochlamydiaceae bacterium]
MTSRLQEQRQKYIPKLPKILQNLNRIQFHQGEETSAVKHSEELKKIFPKTFGRRVVQAKEGEARNSKLLKVGVVFSGGQASGGHNVIAGLLDALLALNAKSQLFGFLGGPSGIIEGDYTEITTQTIASYRNQGGFDLIGSGRTKIETEEQLAASLQVIQGLNLNGLVIIGGDDSNTNAAILAEYFLQKNCPITVVGVPKTIDGDLKNQYVATSFGFDTACKVYSEMIGNIARDALSAKKYTHFIKLMGRSASHIALECALASHPNIAIIGEEVFAMRKTLDQVTNEICDVITLRAEKGKNYGIVLIPEGLIEFIPEMGVLIGELNQMAAGESLNAHEVAKKLTPESKRCFESLPQEIQKQLLLDRDPHGNVQVSLIDTEQLLMYTVKKELDKRKKEGNFKGKFAPLNHFFGYEGRAGLPSNFDANYCTALGYTAALLVNENLTGYMACVGNLEKAVHEWNIAGLPITMLMNMEKRKGKEKPVIQKALVDLKGKPFSYFDLHRGTWAVEDHYRYPGPIQFFGDADLTDSIPFTLTLEKNGKVR